LKRARAPFYKENFFFLISWALVYELACTGKISQMIHFLRGKQQIIIKVSFLEWQVIFFVSEWFVLLSQWEENSLQRVHLFTLENSLGSFSKNKVSWRSFFTKNNWKQIYLSFLWFSSSYIWASNETFFFFKRNKARRKLSHFEILNSKSSQIKRLPSMDCDYCFPFGIDKSNKFFDYFSMKIFFFIKFC